MGARRPGRRCVLCCCCCRPPQRHRRLARLELPLGGGRHDQSQHHARRRLRSLHLRQRLDRVPQASPPAEPGLPRQQGVPCKDPLSARVRDEGLRRQPQRARHRRRRPRCHLRRRVDDPRHLPAERLAALHDRPDGRARRNHRPLARRLPGPLERAGALRLRPAHPTGAGRRCRLAGPLAAFHGTDGQEGPLLREPGRVRQGVGGLLALRARRRPRPQGCRQLPRQDAASAGPACQCHRRRTGRRAV